jgi:predicted TIM-barrel fold metal-dependent hydrolase
LFWTFPLPRRRHHDFDHLVRRLQPRLDASASRRASRHNPGIPNLVEVFDGADVLKPDHGEGSQALLRAIDKGRTWVKVSAGYRLGAAAIDYAGELVRIAGPDRLVWASDCPFVGHENQFTYRSTMDWLAECVPDEIARAKVFGETALRLYFGEGRP